MSVHAREIFKTPFAVLDVETTGLDARRDRILEIAVVLVRPGTPKPEVTLDTLVNPGQPITNTKYHGIRDADVVDAPRFEQIATQVVAALSNRVVVAHNARFDMAFLRSELRRCHQTEHVPHLCTLELDKLTTSEPHMSYSKSLRSLTARYGLPEFEEHRAKDDAMATAYLLRHQLRELKKMGIRTFEDLKEQQYVTLRFPDSFEERLLTPPRGLGDRRVLRPRDRKMSKRVSALAQYLDAVLVALADLRLDDDEIEHVRHAQGELGLSREEIRVVHARVFQAILDRYGEDQSIDLREMDNLHAVAESLRSFGWAPGDMRMWDHEDVASSASGRAE